MSIFLDRKSIRHYDKNYKIPKEELNSILKLALRAPSSMNLQPTKLLVIQSNEAKEKIRPAMLGNHLQLDTSSAFILVLTDLNKFVTGKDVFKNSYDAGILPKDVYNRQLSIIEERNKTYPLESIIREGFLDAGLVAMQLMLVAKDRGYDTCPIGGFNKESVLKTLGIENENLMPVVIISLGKALEKGYDSYRSDLNDVVKFI